jgi:hypothetical protein
MTRRKQGSSLLCFLLVEAAQERQLIQINFYGRLLNVNRQLLTCPSLGNNRRRVKNGVGSFLTLWEDRWVPPFRRGAAVAWECIVLWFLRGSP